MDKNIELGQRILASIYEAKNAKTDDEKIVILQNILNLYNSNFDCFSNDMSEEEYKNMILKSLEIEYMVKMGIIKENLL